MKFLDVIKPVIEYVEKKVKEYCEQHNVDDKSLKQQVKAQLGDNFSYLGYINELLNSMCEVIAQNEGKTFNEIRDEFQEVYLK
jgi:hypothetical protein